MSEYQVSQRDLHSTLGDIIQGTMDLDAVIALRLDIARQGEEQAERILKDLQEDLAKRKEAYKHARESRVYWEAEQAKLEFRRAAEDRATQEDSPAEESKSKLHHSAEFVLRPRDSSASNWPSSHYTSLQYVGKEMAFQMGLGPEDFELEPLSEWVWDNAGGGMKGRAWFNLPPDITTIKFCNAVWERHNRNLSPSKES